MKTTTPQELAYWLQGFFEITDAKVLTTDQVKIIKDKVGSCFEKKTAYSTPKRLDEVVAAMDCPPQYKYKNPAEETSVC